MAATYPITRVALAGSDWQERGVYGRGDMVRDGNVLYVAFDQAQEGVAPANAPDIWQALNGIDLSQVALASPQVPGLVRQPVFDVQDSHATGVAGATPHVGSYTQQHVQANDAALVATIAAAAAAGGGIVYLGPGNWVFSQLLMLDTWDYTDGSPALVPPNNIFFQGAGRDRTFIVQDPTAARGPYQSGQYMGQPIVFFEGVTGGGVRDLTIVGAGAGTTYLDGAGLWLSRGSGFLIENVTIRDAAHVGLYMYRCRGCRVAGLRIENTHATTGESLGGDGEGMFLFAASAYNTFSDLVIETCDGHGVTIDAGTNITGNDAQSPHDNVFTNTIVRKCGQAAGYAGGVAVKIKGGRRNIFIGGNVDNTGLGQSEAIGFYLNQNDVACEDNLVALMTVANLGTGIINIQGGRRNTIRDIVARNIGNHPTAGGDQMAITLLGGNHNNPDPNTGAYPRIALTEDNLINGVSLEQDPPGPFVGVSPCTETPGPTAAPGLLAEANADSHLDTGNAYYATAYLTADGRETAISPLSTALPIASGQAAVVALPNGNSADAVAIAAGRDPAAASSSIAPGEILIYRCHTGQVADLRYLARVPAGTGAYIDTAAWSSLTYSLRTYTHKYFLSALCTVNDQTGATLKAPAGLALVAVSATGGTLVNGQTYRLGVTAKDAAGHETIMSNEIVVTIPAGSPGQATGSITAAWTANGSTATASYTMYRSRMGGGSLSEERVYTGIMTTGYVITTAGVAGTPPWTKIRKNTIINCDLPEASSGEYRLYPTDGPFKPVFSGPDANILAGPVPILSRPAAPQDADIDIDGGIKLTGVLAAAGGVSTSQLAPVYSPTALPVASGIPPDTLPDAIPLAGGSVRGNILWLPCNAGNTFAAYDVSPTKPVRVATINAGGGSTPYAALVFSTQYLIGVLKGGPTGSVVFYNVSNLGAITTAATISGLALPQGAVTFTVANTTYLAVTLVGPTPGQIKIYDISAVPSAPTLVATVAVGAYPWGITTFMTQGRQYLAVCNFNDPTVSFVDVSTPASASVVGTLNVGYYPFWPTLLPWGNGATLLVTRQGTGQAVIVDASAPNAPMVVSRGALSGNLPYQPWVQAATRVAVIPVRDSNMLDVVSLATNPPSVIASVPLAGGPDAVYGQGSRIVATTWDSASLQAYALPSVTLAGVGFTLADGTNFPLLPAASGAPSDAPTSGTLRFDPAAHKLYIYDGSTWRSTTLT